MDNANPAGTDRPAKREKSCPEFHWQDRSSTVHLLGGDCTSFLSRQHDVVASFSCGGCTVKTIIL